MCDLITYYEYKNSNNETCHEDRFRGLFAHLKLNYNKKNEIKILNREKNINTFKNVVRLDNDQFNSNFTVVSNSDILCYEILTADIMEILNEQLNKYDIKFDISIINDNIYFRFYTLPIFEPSINEPVMKKENFYRYYKILDFIIKFSMLIDKEYKNMII